MKTAKPRRRIPLPKKTEKVFKDKSKYIRKPKHAKKAAENKEM